MSDSESRTPAEPDALEVAKARHRDTSDKLQRAVTRELEAQDRYEALRDAVTMYAGDGIISDDAVISMATEHAMIAQQEPPSPAEKAPTR